MKFSAVTLLACIAAAKTFKEVAAELKLTALSKALADAKIDLDKDVPEGKKATIFAPSDEAFKAVPADALETVDIVKVLKAHVSVGDAVAKLETKAASEDATFGTLLEKVSLKVTSSKKAEAKKDEVKSDQKSEPAKEVEKTEFTVQVKDEDSKAVVETVDVAYDHGVIHVIKSVLVPKAAAKQVTPPVSSTTVYNTKTTSSAVYKTTTTAKYATETPKAEYKDDYKVYDSSAIQTGASLLSVAFSFLLF